MRDEYGPFQAATIGAGAAAQSGLSQIEHAYLLAMLGLTQKWQGEEAAQPYRARIGDLLRSRQDEAALYAPLRQARPYATGIGEAIPAYVLGRGAGAGAMRYNTGQAFIENTAPLTVRQLLGGF